MRWKLDSTRMGQWRLGGLQRDYDGNPKTGRPKNIVGM